MDEYTTCRARVSFEDTCGEPAVAIDLDTDSGRCEEHTDEVQSRMTIERWYRSTIQYLLPDRLRAYALHIR